MPENRSVIMIVSSRNGIRSSRGICNRSGIDGSVGLCVCVGVWVRGCVGCQCVCVCGCVCGCVGV